MNRVNNGSVRHLRVNCVNNVGVRHRMNCVNNVGVHHLKMNCVNNVSVPHLRMNCVKNVSVHLLRMNCVNNVGVRHLRMNCVNNVGVRHLKRGEVLKSYETLYFKSRQKSRNICDPASSNNRISGMLHGKKIMAQSYHSLGCLQATQEV